MNIMRGCLAAALASALGVVVAAASAHADSQSFPRVERGRQLATIGDCAACHTAPGGRPFAGGVAIQTPFGTLVTPNITPNRETGIGAWTDAEFIRAMRTGIAPDGRHLYPAFPYPDYTKETNADLLAIRSYLNTIEPVHNAVAVNQLPFPFDVRASMRVWNAMFFAPGAYKPNQAKSAEWNRGAYLVEGLAHCGTCHTPKNMLGADESAQALQGGVLQGWFAPPLDNDPHTGLGGWSIDDVVAYLRTGHNAKTAATGPMAEVVQDSTSHMEPADLRAIAVYLKDRSSDATAPTPLAASTAPMPAGAAIFADSCAACHMGNGQGLPRLFPALSGNAEVQAANPTTVVHVLLQGAKSAVTDAAPTGPGMPAFSEKLDDAEIAAVLTFIRNSWGNAAAPVTADMVRSERRSLRDPASIASN
jgi:mono/diheme cytochrome c family protein